MTPESMLREPRVRRGTALALAFICAAAELGGFAAATSESALVRAATGAAPDAVATVVIAVEGMHCNGCSRGIAAMLKRTAGVLSADVSFERRVVRVEYDPGTTSPDKIVEAITNLGYTAKVKD
jgi:copper chaperone CopZ